MAETLRDIAEFTASKFAPFLPDNAQVNPGEYGAELAFWLAGRLAGLGIVTSYPQNEDWGWYLDYRLPSASEFAVHCSNTLATKDTWQLHLLRRGRKLVYVQPHVSGILAHDRLLSLAALPSVPRSSGRNLRSREAEPVVPS